jgi:transposase
MMGRFDLSDEEWGVIEPLLPANVRGPRRRDDRRVLNRIFYILRTGAPWRDLSERYGLPTTVYNRYVRWGEGAVAVIPSKSNARNPIPHDKNLYAMRNIVERFFCKMKDMRRLATRFEKHAQNFRNMAYLFAIRCWVN